MQWSAIILSLLLLLPGFTPTLDCRAGDDCHQQAVQPEAGHCEMEEDSASSCCAKDRTEQNDQHSDEDNHCDEDCSCSCCHFSSTIADFEEPHILHPPLFSTLAVWTSVYAFEFGHAVWHPPQHG